MKIKAYSILIIILSLVSCSSNENDKDNFSNNSTEAKGYFYEGDKKHKIYYGGIFKMNETGGFKSLFPHSIIDVSSSRIAAQLYQGLLKVNQRTLEIENCLAKKVEISDDGRVYTFSLHDSIYFHDNPCFPNSKGRKLTANDVKYSFDMLCSDNSENAGLELFKDKVVGANDYYESTKKNDPLAGGVYGITVLDDLTLKIELNKPYSFFSKILTHHACYIFPKEAYEKYGSDMRTNCVGTGAFMIDKIKEGTQIRLIRNQNYWETDDNGNRLPYLDIIKITFSTDKKTEMHNFNLGKLDLIWKLPVDEMSSVLVSLAEAKKGGNPEFIYQQKNSLAVQYYSFLHNSEIFKNKDIRTAFNLAIDREKLVKYTLQGEGIPAVHGLVPNFNGYDNSTIEGFKFDPKKARELLKNAGYDSGSDLPEITLQVNDNGPSNIILAEAIQNMLEENLGIKIKIDVIQFSALIENFLHGRTDFWRTSWIADYPDAHSFLSLFYGKNVPKDKSTASHSNPSRFMNAVFDKYFEKAIESTDSEEQSLFYHKCDSILIAEAAFMPIYYDIDIRLLQLNVRGLPQNAMEYRNLSRVFLSQDN